MISLKIDWLDLLVVQGSFRSLHQHHSSKASVLWHPAFFMVQLPQLYMTTGKTLALIIWTFINSVMSLLFHTVSRFVIAFLPRSKCLLIFMAGVTITLLVFALLHSTFQGQIYLLLQVFLDFLLLHSSPL